MNSDVATAGSVPPAAAKSTPHHSHSAQSQKIAADIAKAEEMITTTRATPEIAALLDPVGYPDTELQAGLALHQAAQDAFSGRQSSLGAKGGAKASRDTAETAVRGEFADYRQIVQANFKPGPDRNTLGGGGNVPENIEKFITQARAAYTTGQQEPFAAKLAKNGFGAARLTAALAALEALSTQASAKTGAAGKARGATVDRDAAHQAMQEWVRKFRRVAKVALKAHPEHRAALKLSGS